MSLRNDNIRMMNGGEADSQPCKPIRLLSLFSGIGAFEKALDRENIPYELANFCEIDKFAVKSYCAVHGVSEDKNLGDISKVASEDIPDCDIVTYGYPCQDISVAGKMAGIVEGETRSGLLFEALRIIKNKKPKYAIAENVKNLVGKKFKADFENMLNILDGYGYNSYWQVLNAKDYGIPQNRERVFVVSIRKDVDNGTFKFPEKFPLELRLKDMLEETVNEKYFLKNTKDFFIRHSLGQEAKGNDFSFSSHNACIIGKIPEWHQRGAIYSDNALAPTLCASDYRTPKLISDTFYRIRKLTPKEYWRLMGFDDSDFEKAKSAGVSNSQLYKQAGNSIVVNVLQYIFRNLFKGVDF